MIGARSLLAVSPLPLYHRRRADGGVGRQEVARCSVLVREISERVSRRSDGRWQGTYRRRVGQTRRVDRCEVVIPRPGSGVRYRVDRTRRNHLVQKRGVSGFAPRCCTSKRSNTAWTRTDVLPLEYGDGVYRTAARGRRRNGILHGYRYGNRRYSGRRRPMPWPNQSFWLIDGASPWSTYCSADTTSLVNASRRPGRIEPGNCTQRRPNGD